MPASALICGLVRVPATMLHQLEMLSRFRAEGLVDRIVISTWTGELERYPEVQALAQTLGCVIVESPQPTLKLPGHILHQVKAMVAGLYACPADRMVLKLRGDTMPLTVEYRRILSGEALAEQERVARPTLFNRPIWVSSGPVFWPFYYNDMVFFGTRTDLLTLADVDLKCEFHYNQLAPEQFFHMSPVLRRSPLIRAYARIQRTLIAGDRGGNAAYARAMIEEPLLVRAWAVSARYLVENYYVGFKDAETAYGEAAMRRFGEVSIADMIAAENLPGLDYNGFAHTAVFHTAGWARALLSNRFKADAFSERVAAALAIPGEGDEDLDNPVFPTQLVRNAIDRLRTHYVHSAAKACMEPAGESPRRWPEREERVSVIGQADQLQKMDELNTALRRQVQHLMHENTRLQQKAE